MAKKALDTVERGPSSPRRVQRWRDVVAGRLPGQLAWLMAGGHADMAGPLAEALAWALEVTLLPAAAVSAAVPWRRPLPWPYGLARGRSV